MGEIADMMIEGFLCEGCGAFLDGDEPGFARYCSPECARGRGAEMQTPKPHRCFCGKRFATLAAIAQHRRDKHPEPRP